MAKDEPNTLVLGGTGLVGTEFLKLSSSSSLVKPLVWARTEPKPPFPFQQITWGDVQSGKASIPKSIHSIVCCLGTTIRKAGSQDAFREIDFGYPVAVGKVAKNAGVKNYLVVSALGSDKDSLVFYNRVKGELEKELVSFRFPFLGVFRPSLLLGDRNEFRPGEKVAEVVSSIFPFGLFGLQRYQPIPAKNVARAMLNTLENRLRQNENSITVEYFESERIQEIGK